MKFTESTLKLYAAPLNLTEKEKCRHTISAIRDALTNLGYTDDNKGINVIENNTYSYSIKMRNIYSPSKIHIFIQGSYANNTCVRNESDVDIAIQSEDLYDSYYFNTPYYPSTEKRREAELLKSRVEQVLRNYFSNQVRRGNKSIKVIGNTYRKNADTVPCLSLRYYYRTYLNDYASYIDGIIIYADDGTVDFNYPKQHIKNGNQKNIATHYYYKKMVRIIKKLSHIMSDVGYSSANNVSSFGLESLLWNIHDDYFMKYSLYGLIFGGIVDFLYINRYNLSGYLEANGIKILFPNQNERDNYTEFICDLKNFFEYEL